MKLIKLLTLAAFIGISTVANAGMIVLEGNFMGKNIFVKNPFGGAGVGFCVFEVTINGRLSPDEVNQSAFEIDFGSHGLKIGDKVVINIKHKDDCTPEVLNPEVLKPKSTFNCSKAAVSKDGVFGWTVDNENGKLDYIVEQFRWNKWVKVGEVSGIGTPGIHHYEFKVTPHSGENKFRSKQIDYTGKKRYTKAGKYSSSSPVITLDGSKFKGTIDFKGGETMYEIYDRFGTIVKRGYGQTADINTLEKGTYYVSFDNATQTVQFK
ncbi:MAG: hypothetical protein JKY48_15815 [Flavobacteriales bacterium]|nr:hypothetical protein [Flavobacteriales bacterium]